MASFFNTQASVRVLDPSFDFDFVLPSLESDPKLALPILRDRCSDAFGRLQVRLSNTIGIAVAMLARMLRGAALEGSQRELASMLLAFLHAAVADEECAEEVGLHGGHKLLLRMISTTSGWAADEEHQQLAGETVSRCTAGCARLGRPFPATAVALGSKVHKSRPFIVSFKDAVPATGAHGSTVLTGNDQSLSVLMRELRVSADKLGTGERPNHEVGFRLWGAAVVLGAWLAAHPDRVRGRSVLELGAGLGLCGLVAARCGAARVLLTDFHPRVVENLAYNAALNAAASGACWPERVKAATLDWDEKGGGATALPLWDVILASDVESDCAGIARVLRQCLGRQAVAFVTLGSEKSRFGVGAFERVLCDAGFDVRECPIPLPAAWLAASGCDGGGGNFEGSGGVHVGSASSYRHFEIRWAVEGPCI